MITDSELYHTLKFIDVRRDACNVSDNNEALDFLTKSLELDQGLLPLCE